MNAITAANKFCLSLTAKGVRYHLDIIREGAITVSLAVPGERWEVEFFDEGSIEIEKFFSAGVSDSADPLSLVVEKYS